MTTLLTDTHQDPEAHFTVVHPVLAAPHPCYFIGLAATPVLFYFLITRYISKLRFNVIHTLCPEMALSCIYRHILCVRFLGLTYIHTYISSVLFFIDGPSL
ncbi:hypothetical protein FRC03_004893 [Tulasnella sp. 419]|nr:hypothetical protein FRC03_004893 [Tulasnella sp. 419]